MPFIDIHGERVWIPERPLRSVEEARPVRDGGVWRCAACGTELDREENGLVCPFHQVGWETGREDEPPRALGGLAFMPDATGGVLIAGPGMAVSLSRPAAVNAFFALGAFYGLTRVDGIRP